MISLNNFLLMPNLFVIHFWLFWILVVILWANPVLELSSLK